MSDVSVTGSDDSLECVERLEDSPKTHTTRLGWGVWVGALFVALTMGGLSVCGLSWGLPAVDSWAPDTVAGTRTLRTMGTWPDRWPAHYPPLHFFINQTTYRPILAHWQAEGQMIWAKSPPTRGAAPIVGLPGEPGVEPIFARPIVDKIGLLIYVSRWITVGMSVLTVLVIAACGWRLFDDAWAGLLAGLTIATCAEWVYFSHLGNLDVPQVFWFSLSLYVYIRACRDDRWWHFLLLGVLTALSVSTKDAVAGMYVGMVVVVAATRVRRLTSSGFSLAKSLTAIVHPKMWLGLVAFGIPYAVIHGIFTHPNVYLSRLRYWLVGPGTSDFNQDYAGPIWLAREALAESAKALGWPMLAIMAFAMFYGLVRYRRQALIVLVPCLSYYLLVCSTIGMVYARMLLPVYVCLALLVGRCLMDWMRNSRQWCATRYGVVSLTYLASMGYCLAVDLEMVDDTRCQAERWLATRTAPDEVTGVFARPQYLPRFFACERRARLLPMSREAITESNLPYLLLTSHNYEDFTGEERTCLEDLRAERLGYDSTPVASFTKSYLPPRRRWFALAGWGTRGAGKVSPDIHILKRMTR